MEKIWLKSYPPEVPKEIDPDIYHSIPEMFFKSCDRFANNTAFTNMGTRLTYHELLKLTHDFASYLQNVLQLSKGERLAIMLPNLLQYPVVLFGALAAGLTIVNVNPLYTAPELVHQLSDSGATVIVALANFADMLEKALPSTQIKHVIVTEIGDLMGAKGILINWAVKYVKKMVPKLNLASIIPFKQAMAEGRAQQFTPVKLTSGDIAFLQYTGGTTGTAKGAILTHRNMIANIEQCRAWVTSAVTEGKENVIIALPMYHIFSLTICCLAFITYGCCGVLITNPRDMKNFVKVLAKVPFNVMVGVNTLFNGLLHNPDFVRLNFSQLRLSVEGGMAMQRSVADKWRELTGNYILEGYGLTEASPVVTINPLHLDYFTGSIGLPIPSTEVKICDEEGREVLLGQEGELYVRGPQVMSGYWQKADETRQVLSPDGWLKTGDMVRMDDKGFLFLVDRKKDMIIVSGFNVYPNEVEEVLAAHPGILEVGVVGVADEHSGEVVKAFIVKKDPNLTAQSIIDYAHQHLTRYKVPKSIEFCAELPKSNVGKILRRKLRQLSSVS